MSDTSDYERSSPRRKRRSAARALPAVLPDMRFEQSYVSSIRRLIHELPEGVAEQEKEDAHSLVESPGPNHHRLVAAGHNKEHSHVELWLGRIRIDWLTLVRYTVFDQVFSPLLQGAAFGILGLAWTRFKMGRIASR